MTATEIHSTVVLSEARLALMGYCSDPLFIHYIILHILTKSLGCLALLLPLTDYSMSDSGIMLPEVAVGTI